ncbi:MAG: hypothetical protein JXJ22_06510 [Bacteroidales bacterium]|nr:hypothetical protein [Bacteroidales bacterium]
MKNNFFVICLLVLLCDVPSVFSQSEIDFDLSKYKLPDLKRHQLDMNFNFSNGFSKKNENRYDTVSIDRKNIFINGLISPTYSFYKNSERYQSLQSVQFKINPRLYQNEGYSDESNSNYLTYNMIIHSENRFFVTNKFFLEMDLNLNSFIDHTKNSTIYDENIYNYNYYKRKYNFINDQINIETPVLAGIGRIEQIQDARLAVYILDDLLKANILDRTPTEGEILEFSALISTIKNERFFDSRNKKMYEIQQVDSFLQSRNLIKDPGAVYFTSVYDNWEYSSGPFRETGSRLSVGLSPGYDYIYESDDYKYFFSNPDSTSEEFWKHKNNEKFLGIIVNYIYSKPIKLYWQLEFICNNKYILGDSETNEAVPDGSSIMVESNISEIINQTFLNLNYYPNSRTYYKFFIESSFIKSIIDYEEADRNQKNQFYVLSLGTDFYYYISPRLKLKSNLRIYNKWGKRSYYDPTDHIDYNKINSNELNYQIAASLVYSFM